MKNDDHVGSRQKNQYWQEHIAAWQRSGLTQAEYCRQKALGIKKFGYWQRKYPRSASKPVAFYPLVPAETPGPSQADPIPLLLILKERRFSIEVKRAFSPTALRNLIVTLEEL
ncbi:MAG: hypothetical protein KKB91_00850 [Proteobacteria bacterium]|nr:hypothetical protein [Pseudomonadota bacterium]MCG2744389.1 hypothetical protein [Desulfobacteraceae bacterium]MBU4027865.1 hypothetical protein [Pseudomonadota bacterium]MBU4041597.1 hypothetical protein [Pseudomonadota bacterium]MBU4083817.1 hypothetical protein [Pseudomonadota bacterium]